MLKSFSNLALVLVVETKKIEADKLIQGGVLV
jgi:hypothetical protein